MKGLNQRRIGHPIVVDAGVVVLRRQRKRVERERMLRKKGSVKKYRQYSGVRQHFEQTETPFIQEFKNNKTYPVSKQYSGVRQHLNNQETPFTQEFKNNKTYPVSKQYSGVDNILKKRKHRSSKNSKTTKHIQCQNSGVQQHLNNNQETPSKNSKTTPTCIRSVWYFSLMPSPSEDAMKA
jgi:hypothetical protein